MRRGEVLSALKTCSKGLWHKLAWTNCINVPSISNPNLLVKAVHNTQTFCWVKLKWCNAVLTHCGHFCHIVCFYLYKFSLEVNEEEEEEWGYFNFLHSVILVPYPSSRPGTLTNSLPRSVNRTSAAGQSGLLSVTSRSWRKFSNSGR